MSKPTFAVIECEHPNGLCTYRATFAADGRSVVGFLTEMGKYLGVARWDAQTGKMLEVFPDDQRTKEHADTIAASDDARWLAVRHGETVEIYDTTTLKVRAMLKTSYVEALGWSKDGKHLASVRHRELKCWEAASGRLVAAVTLKETRDTDSIKFVGFSKDGQEILIGRDTGLFTWNFTSGKLTPRLSFKRPDGWFWQHGVSPDRGTMLSLSDRGCLLQTNTADWKSKRFTAVKNSHGKNLFFTPDGKLAVTSTGNGTVFIWDVIESRPWLKWKKPHFGNLGSMAISPDGQRLACTLDFRLFILDFRPGAKAIADVAPSLPTGAVQCVEMVGGDDRMDRKSAGLDALNVLPVKCTTCRMPDLDFVAEPYLLNRGIASPADFAPAEAGNFLVRESSKRVLETVAPGLCRFVPTIHYKTREATPWFLAVPQRMEATATPPANRERCPQCDEPWCFHHYSESADGRAWQSPAAAHDVFKSRNWGSFKESFSGWDKPRPEIFGRILYFSVRLETLLKKLKLRGLVRCSGCKELPSPSDLAWVEEKLRLLTSAGKSKTKDGQADGGVKAWFSEYLKKHARSKAAVADFAAVERKQKLRLPESYKEFISKIGVKSFNDIDDEEGFCARILPPAKLDFDEFRKTAAEKKDDDERMEGVAFATTDHGDAFCFDTSRKNTDYPVFKYNHELDDFEPYAENFAECIKRFASR